jgi:salicylate hydroxylase
MVRFTKEMLIAGGGIGGLAAALACTRAGWRARVFEAAPLFEEVGAGVQLGPNATRVLGAWGLDRGLAEIAFIPGHLCIFDANSGRELARSTLGKSMEQRYGAPYCCVHRADLHRLLHAAVSRDPEVVACGGRRAVGVTAQGDTVGLYVEASGASPAARTQPPQMAFPGNESGVVDPVPSDEDVSARLCVEGDALLGADGLWSQIRHHVVPQDTAPTATGHRAYRSLLRQDELPLAMRGSSVCVWLGTGMHAVSYPVRRGEWLNLVVLVESVKSSMTIPTWSPGEPDEWNQQASSDVLEQALRGCCASLRDLTSAVTGWRSWELFDREPVTSAAQMSAGPVALLGDAAHPMLPYLAQGAAMALEDADALGRAMAMDAGTVPQRLRHYALNRWERAARVQQRSRRNAKIFHAGGAMRWGRDIALSALGQRLLDVPWLYAGP